MKKFILFAILVLGAIAAVTTGSTATTSSTLNITLEKKNTVALREEFTQSSVDNVKAQLIALSQTLPAKEAIYLYLNTPGGSVDAGNSLIAALKGIKNPINVIGEFAASMGYLTEQGTTGKRYVTENGILMAHRAFLGVEGQTPGEIGTRLAFFDKIVADLAAMAAARTGITPQAYQDKVKAEYWVYGAQAVKENQADEVVTVTCGPDLVGTTGETLYTMFGPVDIEWANCPLISGPVSINFARSDLNGLSPLDYYNFQQVVQRMLSGNKLDIINDVSLENLYQHYVR